MATIFGLDVPPGLVDAFNYLFVQNEGATTLAFRQRPSPGDSVKRSNTRGRSLFLRWQGLWNSFDETRRVAWQNYWGTLPFGSHSGANFWPGSGYSAFVYVNAPRYQQGLDPLLDPPSGELLLNGDLNGNADHWLLWYENPGDVYYEDHSIRFAPVAWHDTGLNVYGFQRVTALDSEPHYTPDYNYHCKVTLALTGDSILSVCIGGPASFYGEVESPSQHNIASNGGVFTEYEFDLQPYIEDGDEPGFWLRPNGNEYDPEPPGYIFACKNLSLVKGNHV